jgi:hypothetical protein
MSVVLQCSLYTYVSEAHVSSTLRVENTNTLAKKSKYMDRITREAVETELYP